MAVEIERKFRVLSDAWRGEARERTLLRQGYLANTQHASIRVRVSDRGEAWLSVKSMTPGMSRAEYEVAIPMADARQMLDSLCEGALIEKWRYTVPHAGQSWEVDEFLRENAGLVVAELELDSEDAVFAHPAWLGEEVTHDERYYNMNLSRRPFRHWPENLIAR